MDKTLLTVRLGEFVARLRFDDLPPAVVDKAKAVVNHALTVGMAGFDHPRSAAARRAVIGQETLRDGRRASGEYHGRELMWDFARDARELRRFVPGLPIVEEVYDRLVDAVSGLDAAPSVDALIGLTLKDAATAAAAP
jgi:hypothetical protein